MIPWLCHKIVTSFCNVFVDLASDTTDVSEAVLREQRLLYIGLLFLALGVLMKANTLYKGKRL